MPVVKLLIVTGIYPPEIGGPATYSKLLKEKLPEHGFEVTVLPFSIVRHLPKVIRHLVFVWKIIKLAKHTDIIYAQDLVSVGLPTLLASFILQRSYLLRLGGDYAWEQGVQRFGVSDSLDVFVERKNYAFLVRLLKMVQTLVAKRACLVVVPSEYLRGIVIKWGVSSDKIEVIYSSFKQPPVTEAKESLRSKLDISGSVALSVGRLVPWKGFVTLIESVSMVQSKIPDFKLIIIGDGPDQEHLVQRISELGLEKSVLLLPGLVQQELFEYIKAADIFVLNTAYEGLSHQLLEVMSLGTPVITTEVGGNSELIADGISGLLIPYNNQEKIVDGIIAILTDATLAQRLVAGGYAVPDKFSLEPTIAHLIEVLNNSIKQ